MQGTRSAILYDGWTMNRTRCVGVIATYCTTFSVRQNGEGVDRNQIRFSLLGVSPMSKSTDGSDESSDDEDETAQFDNDLHLHYMEEIFSFFGEVFEE